MKERVLWLCDITTNCHICFVVKMETSYHTRIGNPSGKEILGFIFLRLELTIWWPGSGSCLCDGAMPSNRVSSQLTRVQCSVQPGNIISMSTVFWNGILSSGKFGYLAKSKLCLRTTIKLYIMDMDLMFRRESVNKSTKWKANGEQHALAVT